MKIYVVHSTNYDFNKELYAPIKKSPLYNKHEFIFPHEVDAKTFNSKKLIQDADLVIAEVSYPSTGAGVELGWADLYKTPIMYIRKEGLIGSQSLSEVASHMHVYKNTNDLITTLTEQIKHA